LFGELLVIVAGVLVALAFDAGWDRLQDSESETIALESLAQDVAGARALLDDLRLRDSTTVSLADRLLAFSAVPADTLLQLMVFLFNTTPVDVRLRTYDELLSTGRVQLLQDRELRLKLTEFDAATRSLESFSSQVETQWSQTARPLLYSFIDWDGIASRQIDVWGIPGPGYTPPSPSEVVPLSREIRAVLRDRRTYVAVRSQWFGEPAIRVVEELGGLLNR
jgi:hypothetical protein